MKNIKGISIISDGNSKRLAIIYDVIDDEGKVINANARVNRIIIDSDKLQHVKNIEDIAQSILDNIEE